MRVPLRQVLRTLLRDECGQSLIVIVSSMTVLLAMAGFGIDAATWMVKHHNAQVVADSAALAAAQCLANPNQASTIYVDGAQQPVPECTSSTDTQHAQDVAVAYAAANGLTISTSDVNVDTTNDIVTVTATTTSPGIFARVFGMTKTTQSAQAGAAWKADPNNCSTPGGPTCDFMFAADTSCTSQSNGIQLWVSGSTGVTGNVQSNSNISVTDQDNGAKMGTGTFGPGGCGYTLTGKFDPWSPEPTKQLSDFPYPIDYTKDFPACGGTGELPCSTSNAADGYPSWCTQGSRSWVFGSANGGQPASGNIYCASGTSKNLGDPSTWNGSITIVSIKGPPVYASFVGGSISFSGGANTTLSACGYAVTGYTASNCDAGSAPVPTPVTTNYPLFYATCNSANCTVPAATLTNDGCPSTTVMDAGGNGTATLSGDMFAPGGTMCIPSSNGNLTLVTMIEAADIYATIGGNATGDGPMASDTPTYSGGSETLVQ